ncbi:MAG TPA: methyltransferase domain-containing protein [Gammaproteobacteria bacterium]
MVAITSLQREHIIESVQAMYTEVAAMPDKVFHFPTGRPACEFVGYPASQLDAIPATAVESFAGVGYPFAVEAISKGDVIVDIGSGSGTDVLISSLLTGAGGKVYALDMTEAMREKLRTNVKKALARNIEIIEAEAEDIPLPDASIDVVTSNGVLNLVPDKKKAFQEIFRILKPGGRVQVADIVVSQEISAACRQNPKLWAECIVGAMEKDDYLQLFRDVGFKDVAQLQQLDYFSASVSKETRDVAASLGAHSMVMKAVKS